jgi:hypothetical protein
MANFSISRFFEQYNKLEIPSVGTIELFANTPRYNIADKVFEQEKFHFAFHEDIYQPYGKTWELLADYIDAENPKETRKQILATLEKGEGVHFYGVGTLVKQPYYGYLFIQEDNIPVFNNTIETPLQYNSEREMTVNVGDRSFSKQEMQEKLLQGTEKKSRWWVWIIIGLIVVALAVILGLQYSGTYLFW